MDMNIGQELGASRASAWLVLILSSLLALGLVIRMVLP
jgi:hypothetical protein